MLVTPLASFVKPIDNNAQTKSSTNINVSKYMKYSFSLPCMEAMYSV